MVLIEISDGKQSKLSGSLKHWSRQEVFIWVTTRKARGTLNLQRRLLPELYEYHRKTMKTMLQ